MSGGAGVIGQSLVDAGMGFGGKAPTTTPTGGAAYTPAQQGPVYQPQYQKYQPQQAAPQPQQQQQQQAPNYQSGLQAAMMQMMQQYSRPAMRAPLQQGIAPSSPMTYRPPPVDNIKNVAPSVELQQKQAAEAAAAAAAEQTPEDRAFLNWQREQYRNSILAARND